MTMTAMTPAPWSGYEDRLSTWAINRLVNRGDVWGAYRSTFTYTAPAKRNRGKVHLSAQILASHFQGEHTIGLHSTSRDNTSKWLGIDIDRHDEAADPMKNLKAALHWFERLQALGLHPLLTDSNGKGGFHLRALFHDPIPTPTAFSFGQWLISDHHDCGLDVAPEVFPKQARIDPGRFGNWLRAPGRHHTYDHWSRVWNGERWLDGADAAEFLLSLEGDSPSKVPATTRITQDPAMPSVSVRFIPAHPTRLDSRIRAYLAKLPKRLGAGQHRDDVAYRFAAFLVRDLNLSDDQALGWLSEWDSQNITPKGETRLAEIIGSTHQYGKHAYGCALGTNVSTGVCFSVEI